MATNYPGGLDSFSNPGSNDPLNSPSHSAAHANVYDALEAIEAELGTDPSGALATVKARFEVIEANDWVTAARIAADAVGSSEIAANAVGASELADNAVDTAAIQDSAVTSAKIADGTIVSSDVAADTFAAFGTVGNLLTANQASGTDTLGDTTGFAAYNATVTSSTDEAAQGTRAIKVVTTAGYGGTRLNYSGGAATMPVEPGGTYTFQADCKQTAGTAGGVKATIYWYTSNGTTAASTPYIQGSTVTLSSSWQTVKVTGVAPANAAFAYMIVYAVTGGETVMTRYEDKYLFCRGTGVWAMPGTPIVGGSHIATNGAVNLSGTGAPEGAVSAAPGSTWLQTDSTTDVKGWIKWVKATGTGNTGWVAGAEADTGWRDVSALASGLTGTGIAARIRRVGATVYYRLSYSQTAAAANGVIVMDSAGFLATAPTVYITGYSNAAGAVNGALEVSAATLKLYSTAAANGGSFTVAVVYGTSDSWPSSLPGTAA